MHLVSCLSECSRYNWTHIAGVPDVKGHPSTQIWGKSHSLGGEEHAASRGKLVGLALPAQILGGGSGGELGLAHVSEIPRQMDGLTCKKEGEEEEEEDGDDRGSVSLGEDFKFGIGGKTRLLL